MPGKEEIAGDLELPLTHKQGPVRGKSYKKRLRDQTSTWNTSTGTSGHRPMRKHPEARAPPPSRWETLSIHEPWAGG
jgi:hypothetical protein